MFGRYKKNWFSLKKNHFTMQISKRFACYRHFDRGKSGLSDRGSRSRVQRNRWPVASIFTVGPVKQLIFSGHLGQQLLILPTGRFFVLPCHSISTDNKD
jgi:hypothetical protein